MDKKFVSRAGEKLDFALSEFDIDVTGLVCADFGCSTGGFTDCLLQRGAAKVYSVDTDYGELAWTLRNNPKVVVLEKTNAMHVELPEKVDVLTVDVSWTKQLFVLPNAIKNVKEDGTIISLIKPHYEADKRLLHKGKLLDEDAERVTQETIAKIEETLPLKALKAVKSPILGRKGENSEYLVLWHINK
jgi:23S rRNA (cytidine1920-2'-O)/16S rRNA (cytidine1409-2'-O)-methyltransferase